MSNMEMITLKNDLTAHELTTVSMELERRKKQSAVMWLLWLFLGAIGGHRYYLGDTGRGIAMTLTLGGLGVWALLDAFFIGKRLQSKNEDLEREIISFVKAQKKSNAQVASTK